MAKEFNTILHKRSVLSGTTENSPKLPEADILQYGELAVNYGAGHEAISFKNNNDEVVCVRTDEYYQEKFTDVISDVEAVNSNINLINELIDENEEVTSTALTDLDKRLIALNDRVDAINGTGSPFLTEEEVTNLVNGIVNDLDSIVEDIDGAHVKVSVSQVDGRLSTVTVTESDIASASALTQEIQNRQSGETAIRGEITTAITSATTEILGRVEAVETGVNALDARLGTGFTEHETVTDVIVNNEKIISSALTDLDERVINLEDMVENAGVDEEAVNTLINNKLSDLDSTAEDVDGAHVKVSVSQVDGRLSTVTVTESDIASASALTQEINARQSGETAIRGEITNSISAATTPIINRVEAVETSINTLNGSETTEGSIKKTVIDEIAKVVADAPEDFDTLKEIADWIANDQTGAAALANRVSALETSDTEILEAMEIADEALDNKITAVDARLGTGFTEYETFTDVIVDNEEVIASALTDLDERVINLENMVENAGVDEETVNTLINNKLSDLDSTAEDVDGAHVKVSVSQVDGRLSTVTVTESDIASASALTQEIQNRQSGETAIRGEITNSISAATTPIINRVEAVETSINTLNGSETTEGSIKKTVIDEIAKVVADAPEDFDTLKEIADWIANDQEGAASLVNRISALETADTEILEAMETADEALQNSINSIDTRLGTGFTAYENFTDVIIDNEKVISSALTNLDERVNNLEYMAENPGVDEEAVNTLINNKLSDLDSTAEDVDGAHVKISVSQVDGRLSTVTVTESDIASASALTQEINARQSGETAIRGEITNSISAATTPIINRVEAVETSINTLNGSETTEGSVKKTVIDEIAKVVAGAPDNLDTLKEIADFIANDQEGAASLVNRISALETADTEMLEAMETADEALDTKITAIDARLGTGFTAYENFTDVIIDNEKIISSALTNLDERVNNLENPIKPCFNEDNLNYTLNGNNFPVAKDEENNLYVAVEIPLDHFENVTNKSNVIDENSTDNQYPTSKAVYDQLSKVYALIESYEARITELENKLATITLEEE